MCKTIIFKYTKKNIRLTTILTCLTLLTTVDTVRLTVKLSKCTNYHYVVFRFEPYYEQHQEHVFFF